MHELLSLLKLIIHGPAVIFLFKNLYLKCQPFCRVILGASQDKQPLSGNACNSYWIEWENDLLILELYIKGFFFFFISLKDVYFQISCSCQGNWCCLSCWESEFFWKRRLSMGWGDRKALFLPAFLNVTLATCHRNDWYFLFNMSLKDRVETVNLMWKQILKMWKPSFET